MITVSEKALEHIVELMVDAGITPDSNHLRVGVKGGGCSGLSYVMDCFCIGIFIDFCPSFQMSQSSQKYWTFEMECSELASKLLWILIAKTEMISLSLKIINNSTIIDLSIVRFYIFKEGSQKVLDYLA